MGILVVLSVKRVFENGGWTGHRGHQNLDPGYQDENGFQIILTPYTQII